jgi:replicative DNA helicase
METETKPKKFNSKYRDQKPGYSANSLPESVLRVPPHSNDAERALLGSLLLNGSLFIDIIDTTVADAFYNERHRIIYTSMLELFSSRTPIDIVTVSSRLRELNTLDQVGGIAYLTELSTNTPASANLTYYSEIVIKKHTLRSLISAGYTISELGFQEADTIEATIDDAEKSLFAVTQHSKKGNFQSIGEQLPLTWELMERLMENKDELRGVPTGFKSLDKKLSGFQPSDLIILAARPSVGKTSLALELARSAAQSGNATAIFSLEMSIDQLTQRMLSAEARVDLWKIRTSKGLTANDLEDVREGMARLAKAPIYIDDTAGINIMNIRSQCRKLKMQHDLKLILIDYLQLITPSKHSDNVVTQISDISRALKGLARELNVPVIALSQLSRAVEQRGGKPKLSDLRDSGAIEQDADVVMFIHREANEEGGGRSQHTELLIEKHRNGATGSINLYFDGEKATFLEVEDNDFGSIQ